MSYRVWRRALPILRRPPGVALRGNVAVLDYHMVDGTVYTLNVPAQEIRMSDGRILGLDSAQTADALAAFYSTPSTDSVASDMATVTVSNVCPDQSRPRCEPNETCVPLLLSSFMVPRLSQSAGS